MPSELSLNFGTLPAPFTCWQALYEAMFSLGSANGPTLTGILIQDATPAPEDHDKGWIPTASNVPRFPGYVFVWHATLGHWVSRHYIDASDLSRRIYVGTSASIGTYDGGDAGAPGPASGPMWEIDTAFNGNVPIGVGIIPGTSPNVSIQNPLDVLDSASRAGEYNHSLTVDELAPHVHTLKIIARNSAASGSGEITSGDNNTVDNTIPPFTTDSAGGDASTPPVVVGHNNMMPFVGVFFLKRTSRAFYVAA